MMWHYDPEEIEKGKGMLKGCIVGEPKLDTITRPTSQRHNPYSPEYIPSNVDDNFEIWHRKGARIGFKMRDDKINVTHMDQIWSILAFVDGHNRLSFAGPLCGVLRLG